MSGGGAEDRGEVAGHVVAAAVAVLAAILDGEGGARYRVTSVLPVGWASDAGTDRTWGLVGRIEAGSVRQRFGEGRRG